MRSIRSDSTRREFFGRVAATAAGPYVITSSALGSGGRPPASERITMCMIGIGARGRMVLEAFLSDSRTQCLAVCDVDSGRRALAKEVVDQKNRNKDCAEYGDFRELLDRRDIDAIATATPDFWHVPVAVCACKQGKDVYCEKPLSLTIREARAAVTVARRYERVFQMGTQNRSNPAARLGCEMVRNGGLGDFRFVEVATGPTPVPCHLPAEPVPSALDWDLWLGPVPYRPYHSGLIKGRGWNRYREFSGGGVTDAGAHHFDLAQWALGTEDSYPVEVSPLDPAKHGGRRVAFRYPDGRMMFRRTPGDDIKFVGSRGTIHMVTCAWVKVSYAPKELAKPIVGPVETHLRRGDDNHVANFLDCVRTRQKPVADVELGCRAVNICHIGNIAQWLGRPLKWDPAKEEFVGDDEANRLLGRAKREPWSV